MGSLQIICRTRIIQGATFFDLYQVKIILVVFCYINTIPVKEYREREGPEAGVGYEGIHVKVLNKNFFHLIEEFRVLTPDDHMRKRRTTEERVWQIVWSGRIP